MERETARVAVVGAGIAGLLAAEALSSAPPTRDVLVIEARDETGGMLSGQELAGHRLDAGAESFATRGGHVQRVLDTLDLPLQVVDPSGRSAWVYTAGHSRGRARPLPSAGVLGIPARAGQRRLLTAVGPFGVARVWLDTVLPRTPLDEHTTVAQIVRARMGRRVLDRLVAPVVSGVHTASPDELPLSTLHPGLYREARRHRSLAAAVRALEQRPHTPGTAVRGVEGGMHRIAQEITARLERRGVRVLRGEVATALAEEPGGWLLTTPSRRIHATRVVLATDGVAGTELLASAGLAAPRDGGGEAVELVTLLVRAPQLDAMPRGTGVLVDPGARDVTAKAMTHANAKWCWAAARLEEGEHLVRLSYNAADTDRLTDDELFRAARNDLSALTGAREVRVLEATRRRWLSAHQHAPEGLDLGDLERRGLTLCGAWVAGTGLASVMPHALAAASRILEAEGARA